MSRYSSAALAIAQLWTAALFVACSATDSSITGPGEVTRCGATVEVSSSQFTSAGGEGTVRVATERECRWDVESDAPWLTIGATGEVQGPGTVPFIVAPTSDPVPRTASLSILDRRYAIAQSPAPCRYQLSTLELAVPAAGGTRQVDVTASSALCEWTAQVNVDWIALSGATNRGDGRVSLQMPPWAGPPRRAEIVIADQRVVLTQSDGCTYNVARTSASVSAAAGQGSVPVETSAGCAWTAVSHAPWITVTAGATASGPGAAQFTVVANTGPARSATLTVATRTFTVTQASGCQYRIDPATAAFAAGGGPGAVAVNTAAGCAWTAQSDTNWIAIASGASGSGPGAVQMSVAPNTGPERAGGMTVAGQRFAATQASGCTYALSITSYTFSSTGEYGWIYVTTAPGCVWTATSQVDWIRFTTDTTITGPGYISFVVHTNFFGERSGTLTIGGQTFTATQGGAIGD